MILTDLSQAKDQLEILEVGKKCLQEAKVILMEVSLIDIHQKVPLLHDVVAFMYEYDFVAFDICSLTRRPLDQALWQTDILFVKSNSFLRKNKKWIH